MRQDERRKKVNRTRKDGLKKVLKAALENPSSETVSRAFSALDKASKLGLLHKNTVSRQKSNLAKKLPKTKKTPPTKKSRKATKS